MTKQSNDPTLELLVHALLTLENAEECHNFLSDLCTSSELAEMSRRLQAAKMLKIGYVYADIAEQTGLSTATISRVNRCLKYNHDGGYHTVLERLEKEGRRR